MSLEVALHACSRLVLAAEALEVLGASSRKHPARVSEALPHFVGLEVGKEFNQQVVRHTCHVIQGQVVVVTRFAVRDVTDL